MDLVTLLETLEQIMQAYYLSLRNKLDAIMTAVRGHLTAVNNPHQVDKAQVELGLVENLPLATKQQAEAGLINNAYMTPLRVREAIAVLGGGGAGAGGLTVYTATTNLAAGATVDVALITLIEQMGHDVGDFDLAGTVVLARVLDNQAGSPTQGYYVNGEALLTVGVNATRAIVHNHHTATVPVYVRVTVPYAE